MVSLVILTLNQLPYTRQCLESILRCTPQDLYELILVDNGSSDGTTDFLESFLSSRLPRNRWSLMQNGKNLGFSKGCNQGILAGQGNHILLLNNDVMVTPGWLERLLLTLTSGDRRGIVGPMSNRALLWQEVSFNDAARRDDQILLSELDDFSEALASKKKGSILSCQSLSGFCLLIKREVVECIGLLDESFPIGGGEDIDFCFRALKAGFEVILAEDTFVYHHGGATFKGERISEEPLQSRNIKTFINKWGLTAIMRDGKTYNPEGREGILSHDNSLLSRWNGPLISFDLREPDILAQFLLSLPPGKAGNLLILRALKLFVTGRYTESVCASRELLDQGRSPWEWYILADVLRVVDDEGALAWYERCIASEVPLLSSWAKNQIAVFYSSRGEWERAEETLRSVLVEGLPVGIAHALYRRFFLYNLGYTFSQEKRKKEAQAVWETAMEEDPQLPGLLSNLFSLLLSLGNKSGAEFLLENHLSCQETGVYPGSVFLTLTLLKLKAECNKLDEVISLSTDTLRETPFSKAGQNGRGEESWSGGDTEEGEIYAIRGMAYLLLGRYHESVRDLELALQILRDDPGILNNLATACIQLGRYREARTHLLKAAAVAPWYSKARKNLAVLEKILGVASLPGLSGGKNSEEASKRLS